MNSKVYNQNGHMVIDINGKIYSFAATRSFRPEGRILKDFSEHGLKVFNILKSRASRSQFSYIKNGDNNNNP